MEQLRHKGRNETYDEENWRRMQSKWRIRKRWRNLAKKLSLDFEINALFAITESDVGVNTAAAVVEERGFAFVNGGNG